MAYKWPRSAKLSQPSGNVSKTMGFNTRMIPKMVEKLDLGNLHTKNGEYDRLRGCNVSLCLRKTPKMAPLLRQPPYTLVSQTLGPVFTSA